MKVVWIDVQHDGLNVLEVGYLVTDEECRAVSSVRSSPIRPPGWSGLDSVSDPLKRHTYAMNGLADEIDDLGQTLDQFEDQAVPHIEELAADEDIVVGSYGQQLWLPALTVAYEIDVLQLRRFFESLPLNMEPFRPAHDRSGRATWNIMNAVMEWDHYRQWTFSRGG